MQAAAGEVALVLVGLLVLLLAPVHPRPARISSAAALPAGAGAGILLFALLARERRIPRLGPRAVAALPLLLTRAAFEECVWRWGVLLALSPPLGPGGATAVSSVSFAAAHGVEQTARQLAVRTVLGGTFAIVFLATGRLAGAIAAHAAYNTLVVGAIASWGGERP